MIFVGSWETLSANVLAQFRLGTDSPHGPEHWRRVERYGLRLAGKTGADPLVVRLFALFHDAGRVDEEHDPGHGTRAAALACHYQRLGLMSLERRQLRLLLEACDSHTDVIHHPDPTIATCFDADRLDLARYGMVIDPRFLTTDAAKRIAAAMSPSRESA